MSMANYTGSRSCIENKVSLSPISDHLESPVVGKGIPVAMSTVTRRRVPVSTNDGASSDTSSGRGQEPSSPGSEKISNDSKDKDDSKSSPRFTIMEEVLLLGLKDNQGYLSFWNDTISYVLRGCIVMELAFRGKIAVDRNLKDRKGLEPADRHIEVINDELTGEVLLDEALKMMKISDNMSVATWIDLMSGETWNVMKIGYQLKQVRERLAKGLVDKGVLSTEKRNFLLFDMATHPLRDKSVKEEIIKRVCRLVTSDSPHQSDDFQSYLRSVCLVCAAFSANVLDNALLNMQPKDRDKAFAKVEELMGDYSEWRFSGKGAKMEIPHGKEPSIEVIAGVLCVFAKMDALL